MEKALFEYAPDPYYITDLEGNFVDGNKAAQRITGYQKEEDLKIEEERGDPIEG